MSPIPIEKMEGSDLLARDYKKEGITSRILAKIHKAELSKKKTIIIKLKGVLKKKQLPKWCKVIGVTGITTYLGGVHYGDGETLLAIDVEALGIQQKARQDAQTNLRLLPAEKTGLEFPGEITLSVVYDDKLAKKGKS